jgi:tRNA(Leu) C34 or U34 (ribose-2'-O)-methylase TrmL
VRRAHRGECSGRGVRQQQAAEFTLLTALCLLPCVCVAVQRKIGTHGNQATNRFISWRHFAKWDEFLAWHRSSGFTLIGVEIGARAVNVSTRPFADKTIFMLGNEGSGMSAECQAACDKLVYIPQYGHGTASLNVATAAAIVLHQFAEWAKYPVHAPVEGEKFVVDETKVRKDAGMQLAQQMQQGAGGTAGGDAEDAGDEGED